MGAKPLLTIPSLADMAALSSLAAVGLVEITTKTELSRHTFTKVLRVSETISV